VEDLSRVKFAWVTTKGCRSLETSDGKFTTRPKSISNKKLIAKLMAHPRLEVKLVLRDDRGEKPPPAEPKPKPLMTINPETEKPEPAVPVKVPSPASAKVITTSDLKGGGEKPPESAPPVVPRVSPPETKAEPKPKKKKATPPKKKAAPKGKKKKGKGKGKGKR
jgi:hypothetical protein